MNPLRWKHEHQFAWFFACVLGAAVGMFYGLSRVTLNNAQGILTSSFFLIWLRNPGWYWHWAAIGAVIAGLAFYLRQLIKT